ncbi:Capsular glucan synthase [Acetobacteraceae bacterium EV16G]|uniref:Capsular glucan synthase n=2 Tax=Sorlinia euscelidii TaxID=3081148 RepID=A0ABU7U1Y6_9PROT
MTLSRRPTARPNGPLRVLEVANIDFAMRQFILPIMQGLRDAGCEVTGACAEGPHLAAVRKAGFEVDAVPMVRSLSPFAQWHALKALIRLIRKTKPDVVHAHMPISGFIARVAALYCRVPCIAYTCHGFLFNQPGPVWRKLLSFILEWMAGQWTDLFMTVSEEEAQDARRWRINRHAVANLNGRDPQRFRPDPAARQAIRAELGVDDDMVVILAVSRLVRHKGYPELLRAMEDVPNAHLWIVGARLPTDHGDMMTAEFERGKERLGARLQMLGYRDDVPAIMAASDIFTLPSHFEGLPMAIVEAMLTGLPVVATNIRGAREQILDQETGLIVPVGQVDALARALNSLVDDRDVRRAYGAAGLARACRLYVESDSVARSVRLLTAPTS